VEQLNNNNYSYLIFGISILAALFFLYHFYKAIKSQTINGLSFLTKVLLLLSLVISFLKYQFDMSATLPLRYEGMPPGLRNSLIYIFAYLILFLLTFSKLSKKSIISTWVIILMFNCLAFGLTTYNYLTWSPQPLRNATKAAEIIFGHVMEFTFSRYLFNIAYPTFWIVLSVMALNKFSKPQKSKYSH
jgi:hypothetical protein